MEYTYRAAIQKRYRHRKRTGLAICSIEIDGDTLGLLHGLGWPPRDKAHDHDAVRRALGVLLRRGLGALVVRDKV
jgi:hypothetical protein